jgi:hypothetical protein
MKKIAYYHLYLTENLTWANTLLEQFGTMLDYNLLQSLDEFNITAIGEDSDYEYLLGLLNYYSSLTKCQIQLEYCRKPNKDSDLNNINSSSNFIQETHTLRKLWLRSKNEDNLNILYFHSKGITALERILKTNKQYSTFVNYYHWRKYLEWSVIEKHDICQEYLKNYDIIGCNFSQWPKPHYSGNFWWSKSSFLRTLNDPEDENWVTWYLSQDRFLSISPRRMISEMWIGSNANATMFSLHNHHSPPPKSNLAETLILRDEFS